MISLSINSDEGTQNNIKPIFPLETQIIVTNAYNLYWKFPHCDPDRLLPDKVTKAAA